MLIDSACVIIKLLIFKVCGITGISKIELLNFFGSKKVKQNQNILKTVGKLLGL